MGEEGVGGAPAAEERLAYQGSFAAKVQRFMVANAEAFNTLTSQEPGTATSTLSQIPPNSRYYGDALPLEAAMGVSTELCQKRLLQLLSPGDIVRGHVILKSPMALGVQITSLVGSAKVRDFNGLDIRGIVQEENLSEDKNKCERIMNEMEMEDVIQAIVIAQRESHVILSFSDLHVTQLCPSSPGVHLGYLDGERADSSIKRPQSPAAFLEDLEDLPGFANPSCSQNLKRVLGVEGYDAQIKPSLIRVIQKADYPESDYFDSLRKAQRRKWSMDTVAVGVKHFKKGELDQAKKLLNHALDIDPSNVEGLVARGALMSNGKRYNEAIVDFEKALTINHTHRNARKYLVETQVAYGAELERQGSLERAVVCYREALADDPSQDTAKTRLEMVLKVLERKAAEKMEREKQEAAEAARLKRLHSLIKEEKERKKKKSKASKRVKKKTKKTVKKKNRLKKTSKHKRYSSDSEDSYSSSSSSSSLSPSYRKSSKKGGRKRQSYSRSPSPSSKDTTSKRRRTYSRSSTPKPSTRRRRSSSRDVSFSRRASARKSGKKQRSRSPPLISPEPSSKNRRSKSSSRDGDRKRRSHSGTASPTRSSRNSGKRRIISSPTTSKHVGKRKSADSPSPHHRSPEADQSSHSRHNLPKAYAESKQAPPRSPLPLSRSKLRSPAKKVEVYSHSKTEHSPKRSRLQSSPYHDSGKYTRSHLHSTSAQHDSRRRHKSPHYT